MPVGRQAPVSNSAMCYPLQAFFHLCYLNSKFAFEKRGKGVERAESRKALNASNVMWLETAAERDLLANQTHISDFHDKPYTDCTY